MQRILRPISSRLHIGLIGFCGGNALLPVLEQAATAEHGMLPGRYPNLNSICLRSSAITFKLFEGLSYYAQDHTAVSFRYRYL